MFNAVIYQPILDLLVFLYQTLGNNLAAAIIVLTLIVRFVLLPLTLPAMRSANKMKELQPEIDKLKKKYAKDKQALQQAQLKLYQSHNINPASGCLPYLVQFIILIALYHVFIDFLQTGQVNNADINRNVLWLDLTQPDTTYVLPIIAGVTQLILALMISPATSTSAEKTLAASTTTKKDDRQADQMADMAQTMQQQMIFIMPVMTLVIATRFPSGLALYWIVTTVFSVVQQYIISGPGKLGIYAQRLKLIR